MERLLQFCQANFYTNIVMLISSILLTIVGIRHWKKFSSLQFMGVYGLLATVQSIVYYVLFALNKHLQFENIVIYYFILFEFVLLYAFLLKCTTLKRFRPFLLVFAFTFLIAWLWVKFDQSRSPTTLYFLQAFLIITPCFIYIIELFKNPPRQTLVNTPEFWAISGMLFYFGTTLPVFAFEQWLLERHLFSQYSLYCINYCAYTILFSFIIKGFLCPQVTAN